MISIDSKSNFFEKRVGDYQKAGVKDGKVDAVGGGDDDEDF